MANVTGWEGIVAAETEIGMVDGVRGYLVYRGQWAKDLAVSCSFEETAHLLWKGWLPDAEELLALRERTNAYRELPGAIRRLLDAMPGDLSLMSALQSAVAAVKLPGGSSEWPPTITQAEYLVALLPSIITYRYRRLGKLPPIDPDPDLDHVGNYLYMLTGRRPDPDHAKALNAYLILAMEHGMNASTFAGRVVMSTQSSMGSAVSAAIGAMMGTLHGGAPSEVIAMLEQIGTPDNAEPWLRGVLERGGRLMGFGHRIYKTRDPRAEALRAIMRGLTGGNPEFALALHVEDTAIRLLEHYKPGRKLYTNVEYYAAAIMRAINLPAELFTPTFTIARSVGWTAHMLEQASVNRIFRPQSQYTGAFPTFGD